MNCISLTNGNIAIEQKGKNVRISFIDFKEEFNHNVKLELTRGDVERLIGELEILCTVKVKKEDKAYTEDINTYKNEVERTISISRRGFCLMHLDVYTDVPNDDNWIDLTPKRLSYLVGILYGYLLYLK